MSAHGEINYYENKLELRQIIEQFNLQDQDEAVYICDLDSVVRKFQLWRKLMPSIKPYYAVKCNNDPLVLRTLVELGAGFDCASKNEIKLVLDLGATPDDIIFAHPCKPVTHLKYAKEQNVSTSTVDNEFEIYKLHKQYPQSNLVVRFRSDAHSAKLPLGQKFGCEPQEGATGLILLARRLNLKVMGTSFHVGCECMEIQAYERAIETAKSIYDVGKLMGYDMKLLDIGGGYPGSNDQQFEQIGNIVNKALETHFYDEPIEAIAEPGRLFVETAFTLICKIQGKREVRNALGQLDSVMYYINDGVFGSFINVLIEHDPVKVIHFLENDKNLPLFKTTIWGPTCDSTDKITDNIYLPNLNLGDLIGFPNMGAYTLTLASQFNGIPLPKTIYFKSKEKD